MKDVDPARERWRFQHRYERIQRRRLALERQLPYYRLGALGLLILALFALAGTVTR